MKIILQNAILMVELVAITTLQDGMSSALIVNAYRAKQRQLLQQQQQQPPQLKVRKFQKEIVVSLNLPKTNEKNSYFLS